MTLTAPHARRLLLPCVAVLLLAACNKQGPEAPVVAPEAEAGADVADAREDAAPVLPPPPPMPEASPNVLAVGSALGDNGAVQAPKPTYALSDTVYASVPVEGHAPGDTVTAWWTSDAGDTETQTKQIEAGAEYVNFAFSQADGMQAGGYNVQVDVNDVPVGLVDFTVE